MKVLVTGGSGLLGHKIVKELLSREYEVIALYNTREIPLAHPRLKKVRLDITNGVVLEDLILKVRPDVIVHSAAYTDVDGCEINREYAWRVNVEATRSIVRASRVTRSYLVYISTDYVFDGEKGFYLENDIPNPINYYGLTKLLGEEITRSSDILYAIIRPSAIYGLGTGKLNFALFVVNRLSRGEIVKALTDQYVSPTLNTLLAQSIVEVIDMRYRGVLHIAGERMSRYVFALKIAKALGLPENLIVKARMEDLYWKARRPRDSSLNTSRAKSLLNTRFYDTDLAMKIFAEEYRRGQGAI